MTDEQTERFIVEYRDSPTPVYYIKDRLNVPAGFKPVVIAIVPRKTYAEMIARALNETHPTQKDGAHHV